MRVRTLEIRWHNGDPIYACDFQPLPQSQLKKTLAPRVVPAHKDGQPSTSTSNGSTPAVGAAAYGVGQSFRFATGGSDNNVRIWMVYPNILPPSVAAAATASGQPKPAPHPPRVEYLATLVKHAGAVNVVRFSPNGEYLASAGDDGMIIIWMPTDRPVHAFGADPEEAQYEKEHWKAKVVLRCTSREVYDLAWSPNGEYIIAGSTDNTARVYTAADGICVREIAEHSHYVQGVAWDPLNEFVASQSSDRSVHVYGINTKRGSFDVHAIGKNSKISVRHSRTPSGQTPGRPTYMRRGSASASEAGDRESVVTSASELKEDQLASYMSSNPAPGPSAPMSASASSTAATPAHKDTQPLVPTPTVAAPPTPTMSIISTPSMNPPREGRGAASRRSSFSNSAVPSPAPSARHIGRSPSPMPPLPAIRAPQATASWATFKMYGDESFTNFFRRLTFSPDGAFLLTPAGQFEDQTVIPASRSTKDDPPSRPKKGTKASEASGGSKSSVYIYSRANFSRPPIAHLPGHQKASVAVKFSPLLYELRQNVAGGAVTGLENDVKRIGIERGKDQSVDVDMGGTTAAKSNSPADLPSTDVSGRPPSTIGEPILPPPPRPASSMATPEKPIHAPAPRRPSASPSLFKDPSTSDIERRAPTPAQTPSKELGQGPATGSVFALPYRMLYSVATQDTIMIYDTQQSGPVCMFTNLHYASFTDMSWAPDGQSLMLASSDGYCSIVVFDELLPLYHTQQHNMQLQAIAQSHTVSPAHARDHSFTSLTGAASSSSVIPPPSPALSISSSIMRSGTPGVQSAPLKRTERSESTSSIAATPALGLQDLGPPGPPPPSIATLPTVDSSASSSNDADAPPAKKKRRIALTRVEDS